MSTSKGHLDQERPGLQTKKSVGDNPDLILSDDDRVDFFPSKLDIDIKTHECMALVIPFQATQKAYMDSCGRFPHHSSQGNEYIMVVYDYDSNAILAEAFKNRTAGELKMTLILFHNRFCRNNIAPKLYILDNEISPDFRLR